VKFEARIRELVENLPDLTADHVKTFGEGINHPDCCFSPDVVVYPCRQEARLLRSSPRI
jgi:hypothetical protein